MSKNAVWRFCSYLFSNNHILLPVKTKGFIYRRQPMFDYNWKMNDSTSVDSNKTKRTLREEIEYQMQQMEERERQQCLQPKEPEPDYSKMTLREELETRFKLWEERDKQQRLAQNEPQTFATNQQSQAVQAAQPNMQVQTNSAQPRQIAQSQIANSLNNDWMDEYAHRFEENVKRTNYLVPEECFTDEDWGKASSEAIDNYVKSHMSNYPGKTNTGIMAPINDMIRNYKMVRNMKIVGADSYGHCRANYEAAKRGYWGQLVGKIVSAGRELSDLLQGSPLSDSRRDWVANTKGWTGAQNGKTLEEACPSNPKEYVNIDDYK